jgi:serine/threonine-protein kinase
VGTESLPGPSPLSPGERAHVEPRRGMHLGRYELLFPIARGGMAEVWAARQSGELGFRRIVALKTIRAEYAESVAFRRMFLDEAAIAARIHHANVVEVLDLGEEGPIVFQAMTLVEGETIAGLTRRWRKRGTDAGLPPAIALRIMADALSGLHAAHELTDEEGIPIRLVHRDISPQNILVGIDGVSKIADFGIAKALGRLADETEAGQVKGKFSYMAPEALERRTPDRRSDVFSAGVVLWEALTGARLFRGIDVLDTLAKLKEFEIPDPRESTPDLPKEVAEATLRALARAPEDRYASAAEMSDGLESAARSSGFSATTKEIAAFVQDLAGADVERQREAVRDACRTGTGMSSASPALPIASLPETFHATTIADPPSMPTTRSGSRSIFLFGTAVLIATVAGAVALTRDPPTPASPSISTSPSPSPSPSPPIAPSTSSSAPSASASAPPPASASASAAPSARSRSPVRPPPSPSPVSPRPKFGNPYGP